MCNKEITMHTKFAIVTVVYNAETAICKTIESVLVQNSDNYQYIIMDGLSEDRTLEFAGKYIKDFDNKHIDYRIYSEKDSGIYDAMNKSIAYINSDYVLFLNAGDLLFDRFTLSQIERELVDRECDVLYGDYYLYFENKRKKIRSGDAKCLKKWMITTHQAIFTRVDFFQNLNFKHTLYKMAADYDFFLTLFEEGARFYHVDYPIVYFEAGGESQRRAVETQTDVLNIKINHQLISKADIPIQRIRIVLTCTKKYLLSIMPRRIRYYKYEHYDYPWSK